jgi:hypothetical protein
MYEIGRAYVTGNACFDGDGVGSTLDLQVRPDQKRGICDKDDIFDKDLTKR